MCVGAGVKFTAETEPLNKIHEENQDQNDASSQSTSPHAENEGWSHRLIYTLPTHTWSTHYHFHLRKYFNSVCLKCSVCLFFLSVIKYTEDQNSKQKQNSPAIPGKCVSEHNDCVIAVVLLLLC